MRSRPPETRRAASAASAGARLRHAAAPVGLLVSDSRCLDLRGILDERTLAGLRLLDRTQGGHAATSLAVSLPALETLSVGFPLHSVLGAREGEQFLTAQAALAPRLRHVGCRVSAEAASVCTPPSHVHIVALQPCLH